MQKSSFGKILVTGANGMLGRDLCPMLEDCGYEVIETDIDNLDITNQIAVRKAINETKPDYLIHCAAYTNVEKAEVEPEIANKINSLGTEYIAKACKANNVIMVYISTDYVFDGKKNNPYKPSDKTNPLNEYGRSKLNGEKAVIENCPNHYIARTSWLYGHHGKNFVETMLENSIKKELKVVNDQIGSPTWTVDLSEAIITLIEEEAEYGIYHICGDGSTTWYDFAKEIFELANRKVDIKPCTTLEFPQKATRPQYSVMDNQKLLRNWKLALKEYLELRFD